MLEAIERLEKEGYYDRMGPKVEIVTGIEKEKIQLLINREKAACIAEGHQVPEGDMCRRQYARNVLQELL